MAGTNLVNDYIAGAIGGERSACARVCVCVCCVCVVVVFVCVCVCVCVQSVEKQVIVSFWLWIDW